MDYVSPLSYEGRYLILWPGKLRHRKVKLCLQVHPEILLQRQGINNLRSLLVREELSAHPYCMPWSYSRGLCSCILPMLYRIMFQNLKCQQLSYLYRTHILLQSLFLLMLRRDNFPFTAYPCAETACEFTEQDTHLIFVTTAHLLFTDVAVPVWYMQVM